MFSTLSFVIGRMKQLRQEFGYLGVALALSQCQGVAFTPACQWLRDLSAVTDRTDSGLRRPALELSLSSTCMGPEGLVSLLCFLICQWDSPDSHQRLYEPEGWHLYSAESSVCTGHRQLSCGMSPLSLSHSFFTVFRMPRFLPASL